MLIHTLSTRNHDCHHLKFTRIRSLKQSLPKNHLKIRWELIRIIHPTSTFWTNPKPLKHQRSKRIWSQYITIHMKQFYDNLGFQFQQNLGVTSHPTSPDQGPPGCSGRPGGSLPDTRPPGPWGCCGASCLRFGWSVDFWFKTFGELKQFACCNSVSSFVFFFGKKLETFWNLSTFFLSPHFFWCSKTNATGKNAVDCGSGPGRLGCAWQPRDMPKHQSKWHGSEQFDR